MFIRRSSQQQLETLSRAKLKQIFSSWVVNDLTNDFGLDFEVRLSEKESNKYQTIQSESFYMQVRASHNYSSHPFVDLEVRHLLLYIDQKIPVVLIKYYEETDKFYWVVIQDYFLDFLQKEANIWFKQQTKRILLKNELNDINELKKKVITAQTRIIKYHASLLLDGEGLPLEQDKSLGTLETSLRNPSVKVFSLKPKTERILDLSDFLELFNNFANSILPGIGHGCSINEINSDLIILMREKAEKISNLYNEELDQFHQNVSIHGDWIVQRAWFIAGNFWYYLGEKIRAELHYEVLKSVNAVINPKTNEPSFKESDFFFNYGVILYDKDREKSLRCFCRVTQIDPQSPTPWYNKGYVLQTLGSHEDAIDAYNKAVELNEKYLKAWVNLGYSFAKIGKIREALNAYDNALKLDSKNQIALLNKGITLKKDGEFKEATKIFNKAIKYHPDDSSFYVNRGLVFIKMEKFNKSIKDFDKALEVNPLEISAYINKGYSLSRNGQDQKALEIYELGITNDKRNIKRNVLLWYNKGVLLEKLNRLEEALITYNKVINIEPAFVYAWINKSSVLIRLGRFEESLTCLNVALEIDPNYFDTVDELLVDQMKK